MHVSSVMDAKMQRSGMGRLGQRSGRRLLAGLGSPGPLLQLKGAI